MSILCDKVTGELGCHGNCMSGFPGDRFYILYVNKKAEDQG